ncbi:MAG: hypothetical protein GC164_16065 [Phycisphaera sp.]|nr:hypothetical protein [Phycisphaera sp.]
MSNQSNIKIMVSDRESVERGLPMREPYVLISIRDPYRRPVRIRPHRLCQAVLELAFHDAEPVAGFEPIEEIVYMSEDQARAIWKFVREHVGRYTAIVVHCEQGMSRSPAVAAALAVGLGVNGREFWEEYQPNTFVFRLMACQPDGA